MIIIAFLAELVMMSSCLAIILPKAIFTPGCLVAHVPGLSMAFWYVLLRMRTTFRSDDGRYRMSSLAFETFLFVLTLIKFFQTISRDRSSILFIFMRDGTWAFALIFGENAIPTGDPHACLLWSSRDASKHAHVQIEQQPPRRYGLRMGFLLLIICSTFTITSLIYIYTKHFTARAPMFFSTFVALLSLEMKYPL
jgi:hypothetical protein